MAAWAAGVAPRDLYVTAVTIVEIKLGVQRMERRDAVRGVVLRAWMDNRIRSAFRGRVLPFDEAVALRCSGLHAPADRLDQDALVAIAAAAGVAL